MGRALDRGAIGGGGGVGAALLLDVISVDEHEISGGERLLMMNGVGRKAYTS
jgi:hypothetical protein